jgi:hypothetical protein
VDAGEKPKTHAQRRRMGTHGKIGERENPHPERRPFTTQGKRVRHLVHSGNERCESRQRKVSGYGQVELQDDDDFEEQGKQGEEFLEALVFDFEGGGAEDDAREGARVIERSERVEIVAAFD